MNLDDTIVAVSTAAGSAARAIVRVSGPGAMAIAGSVFVPAGGDLAGLGGFRWADGLVHLGPMELPARAYVFRSPRSYTRQDVVELHVPGSAPVAAATLSALLAAGARQAEPGEFTARAFFSGRLDLSEARAVADVIDAASDAQLRSAGAVLAGGLRRCCDRAVETLMEALAVTEASIDLSEEGLPLDPPVDVAARLAAVGDELAGLADGARRMPDAATEPRVVLAGRPNAGKSSLLNALSRTDRAIVSALAGTTRDVLSAPLELAGCAAMLQDAAGIGQAADPLSADAAAGSAARQAVAAADALLFCVDRSLPDHSADAALLEQVRQVNPRAPLLVLACKADLPASPADLPASPDRPARTVSSRTGEGLEELRRELADMLGLHAGRAGEALGLHDRQRRLLTAAAEACRRGRELLAGARELADVGELLAVELRDGLAHLARIVGRSPLGEVHAVTEDALGRIFARFCVGK